MTTAYNATDYETVDTKDGNRVVISAEGDEYAIHQFIDFVGSNTSAALEWYGRTNVASTSQTAYLQIYNNNTSLWEEVANNSGAAADEDFTLSGNVTLTDYVIDGLIYCRVYQFNG